MPLTHLLGNTCPATQHTVSYPWGTLTLPWVNICEAPLTTLRLSEKAALMFSLLPALLPECGALPVFSSPRFSGQEMSIYAACRSTYVSQEFFPLHWEEPKNFCSWTSISSIGVKCWLLVVFVFVLLLFLIRRLTTLQYYDGFCHTPTWISHRYTYVPLHWTSLPPFSHSHPSWLPQSAGFVFPVSYSKFPLALYFPYAIYMFQCYSFKLSQLLSPQLRPKVCSLCLDLLGCFFLLALPAPLNVSCSFMLSLSTCLPFFPVWEHEEKKEMQPTIPLSTRFPAFISYTIWKEWGGEKECSGLILIRSHKMSVAPLHNCPQFWDFWQNCREQEL